MNGRRKDNEEQGLEHERWSFVNREENLLTRLQNINLAFHFECVEDLERTTAEDMDIAVRAYLHGWKFIFLNDVESKIDLIPNLHSAFETMLIPRKVCISHTFQWYLRSRRNKSEFDTISGEELRGRGEDGFWSIQLVRSPNWTGPARRTADLDCLLGRSLNWTGPARRTAELNPVVDPARPFDELIIRPLISIGKKFNLIFFFFLLKKLILPFNSFTLFCIILPMTMFVPKTELPAWVVCYIPSTMSFLNILPAPKSFPFIVPYLLFDNTMSVTKFNAMVSGLFQLGSAYE
uniref:Glycosyltransferase 2-like domain-containing protein n=1 Tax=Brassica oleracea TaxID=3712 RepID=A0A3P6DZP6_BRAOL|nr:unnamed protein product [Brassica oleracea]